MDTIDVQNKAFVVRWVRVSQGDVVSFRLKPLKKSIGFGIYRRFDGLSSVDLNNSDERTPSSASSTPSIKYSSNAKPHLALADHDKDKNVPLQTRLVQSGLEKVIWYGTISNNTTVSESFESTCENCYYAFILDNTTSKQTKKKCLFSVSIKPPAIGVDSYDDDERSFISNQDESVNTINVSDNNTNTASSVALNGNSNPNTLSVKRALNYSQSSFHNNLSSSSLPYHNQQSQAHSQMNSSSMSNAADLPGANSSSLSVGGVKQLSPASTATTDLDLKNSRYFQGYLLKKKRKKLQGFTKRFFKLDIKFGILSYYLNSKSPMCRGEIVIPLSSVSANKQTKLIIIDSGMEIWILKARDPKDWEQWISMIESCFKQEAPTSSQDHESRDVVTAALAKTHDTDTTGLLRNLTTLRKRIEECKNMSLSYSPTSLTLRPPVSAIQAPPNASKQRNISRSSSVSSFKNNFSRQKNGPFTEQSPNSQAQGGQLYNDASASALALPGSNDPQQHYHHALYYKLVELEKLAKQLDLETNQIADKWIPRSPPASIFSDDEYFDANEEPIITMLNDDVAYENDVRPTYNSGREGEGDEEEEEDDDDDDEEEEEEEDDDDEEEEYRATTTTNDFMTPVDRKEREVSTETQITKSQEVDLSPLPIHHQVKRRNDIKAASSSPPSLLSFLRKNVGKDLSSISMPISINEPVSILQVLSEAFEYSWLLNKAAEVQSDEVLRLKYISAFALSYMSIHRQKTRSLRKPFTPLLGETYELVREDMGFRLISEKVCHKPPVFASYTEHRSWKCGYTLTPVQKFWGKSIEFTNEGQFELTFSDVDTKYKWAQPTLVLKNIIAGERYMEPTNQFTITSSKNIKSIIAFKSGGMFSGRSEDVDVTIVDDKGKKLGSLKGQWTKGMHDVDTGEEIWKCGPLLPNSEKKYGFTVFTSNLNEITEIEKNHIPSTDSRLRPDIRMYENGRIKEAEEMKLSLEQKQRDRREKGQDVQPQYFKQVKPSKWVPIVDKNGYWEKRKNQSWSTSKPLW